jgi:hypothetical protein
MQHLIALSHYRLISIAGRVKKEGPMFLLPRMIDRIGPHNRFEPNLQVNVDERV